MSATVGRPMTSYEQYDSDDHEWPYAVEPVDPNDDPQAVVWKGDREYLFKATDGNVYQGRYCRAMVDNGANTDQPVWLGFDKSDGNTVPIHHRSLFRGGFVGGRPGEGKTTAASNFMIQLAQLGHGFMFLDPGGEEYLTLIQRMPERAREKTVVIDPTADWRDRSIGFNFIESFFSPGEPGFKEEVESKVGAMLPMLQAEYPLMKGVAENMLRALIKAHSQDDEYDYCLIDVYYALNDTEEYAHMVEEQKLSFLQGYAETIRDEIDDDQLEPLLRRLKNWIESDLIRPLVAQRTTDLSMEKVVSDDYHVIVNVDVSNPDTQRMVMLALSQLLWSVIFSRPSTMERQLMELEGVDVPEIGGDPSVEGDLFKPFFFIADEFHTLADEDAGLARVLALARKKRLGIFALSQQVAQLPKDDRQAMKANTAFKLAFNPGHDRSEANYLAKAMPGKDVEDFTGLKRFHAITLTDEAEQAFEVHMLPLYPPRRTLREANQWFRDALEKYGHETSDEETMGPETGRFGGSGGSVDVDAPDAESEPTTSIDERQRALCKATYDEALHTHGVGEGYEWVSYPDVHERYNRYTGTEHTGAQIASILQGTPEVKFDDRSGKQLRCTEDGFARFMPGTDPGDESDDEDTKQTQGGASHHSLLHDAYDELTCMGLEVSVEEQSGGADVDGVGRIRESFDPDFSDPKAYAEAVDEFRTSDETKELAELSGLGEVTIEAESSTSGKPAATCANLRKAYETERICWFLARPENVEKVHGTLTDPPYVRGRSDGDVRLYNRKRLVCDDEYVLRPAGAERSVWRIEDGVLGLYDTEGRGPHATFDPPESVFDDGASDAFPATEADVDEGAIGRGEEWRWVAYPWIPDVEFDGDVPDEDSWRLFEVTRDGEVTRYDSDEESTDEDVVERSPVFDEL